MVIHQDGNGVYVISYSEEGRIIDRMILEKRDVIVRLRTITLIENLPLTNADNPSSLLSYLPIRDRFVSSSLTSEGSNSTDGKP